MKNLTGASPIKRATGTVVQGTVLLGLLGLWEMGYRREWWNAYLFPGPSEILSSLRSGLNDGSLYIAVKTSLLRLVLGFSVALVLGIVTGITMGLSPWLQRTLRPVTLGLQTLPSICWQPIAIIWFGLSERAILFVTVMGALLSISIAVTDGISTTPAQFLKVAEMLGAKKLRIMFTVILPAATPAIISGSKQGWAFAWRSLMAGELLSVSTGSLGLGQALMRGRDNNDMAEVFAVMIIIVLIGIIADQALFVRVEKFVNQRWGTA